MAGSYNHIVNTQGELISNDYFPEMIENLGDAYEAVEEMYFMIQFLSKDDKELIKEAREYAITKTQF